MATSPDAAADGPGWTEGFEYIVFHNVNITSGDTLTLTSSKDHGNIAVINGVQLERLSEGTPGWVAALTFLAMAASRRKAR